MDKRNFSNKSYTLKIGKLRKEIARKIASELIAKFREYKKHDKFPWEGMWLTKQQIIKTQKIMKTRDKIIFIEIIVVFILIIMIFQLFLKSLTF
jgi:hypothetical protein